MDGVNGLRSCCCTDDYVETFVAKMLTYARPPRDYRDDAAIRKIVRARRRGGYRWSTILGVVTSTPFQMGSTAC
ncbi:MAG: DUF1585 domain-containing protein [Vicinamibacterales bacterium]